MNQPIVKIDVAVAVSSILEYFVSGLPLPTYLPTVLVNLQPWSKYTMYDNFCIGGVCLSIVGGIY
jgi:hypothetical protein